MRRHTADIVIVENDNGTVVDGLNVRFDGKAVIACVYKSGKRIFGLSVGVKTSVSDRTGT